MKPEEQDQFMKNIAIATVVLAVYVVVAGFDRFFAFIGSSLLSACASVFFIFPLVRSITRQRMKEPLLTVTIGFGFFLLYVFVSGLTWIETLRSFLENLLYVTIIFILIDFLYRWLAEKVPPEEVPP